MYKIFNEILSMSVDSIWLIFAVLVVRAIVQKAPMYFRKILWGLVGLRLVIPFSLESSFSLVPQKITHTAESVDSQVVVAPIEQGLSFYDIFSVIWLVVCVGFFAYDVVSYIKLKLKIIDGVLVKENIYYSDRIESPFVCGLIKPRIYLPYDLDEVTQNCVLQHEKSHIKNGDHIIKAISFVVLCVHWFNPLVWISYFLLCKDIELSCDESVIKKYDATECKQYAKALLELGVNKVKFTACPVAFGEVSIKARIKNVINYKQAGKFLISITLILCVVVVLCFMTDPEVMAKSDPDVEEIVVEKNTGIVPETTTVVEETEIKTNTSETTVVTNEKTENSTKSNDKNEFENDAESDAVTIIISKPDINNYEEEIIMSESGDESTFNVGRFFVQNKVLDGSNSAKKYPMLDEALEAGVFADDSEIEILEDALINKTVPLDDVG